MSAFGTMLRDMRNIRRYSQLTLAVEANISSKHISFLETGRAKPSKEMVLHLARMLDLDLAGSNRLLGAAGYGHIYKQNSLDDDSMKIVNHALDHLLNSHLPYPALLMDRHYNLINANQAQMYLAQQFVIRGAKIPESGNMVEAFFLKDGLRPFIEDWESLAVTMLQRIHQEHLLSPYRDRENTLLTKLLEQDDIPSDWRTRQMTDVAKPVIGFTLKIDGTRLNMFSTISSFGTPMDVTVQDLRVEHFFPADDETRKYWQLAQGSY